MITNLKYLESINDFPKVGLIYIENSGENLLRFYLEKIFRVKTGCNIKKEYNNDKNLIYKSSENIYLNWIIASDYPHRNKEEYMTANISSAILLVRNPIDLIMSKILRESYFLEDAVSKIDVMINEWKEFYKYWINAPIPVHIVRYEDLLYEPYDIVKQLSKFLLGNKTIENTKLEYSIKSALSEKVDKHYYAYDVEVHERNQSLLTGENIEKIQKNFYDKLDKILKKFNYEVNTNTEVKNWMADFNKENLVKSVEFHDFLNSQFMTASYFSIKIS